MKTSVRESNLEHRLLGLAEKQLHTFVPVCVDFGTTIIIAMADQVKIPPPPKKKVSHSWISLKKAAASKGIFTLLGPLLIGPQRDDLSAVAGVLIADVTTGCVKNTFESKVKQKTAEVVTVAMLSKEKNEMLLW